MLTARIHLDAATEENGPLRVIPGSHRDGKTLKLDKVPPVTLVADQGDVLLIRPLVTHCSNRSHADTQRQRRILHLEFAAHRRLPDGYEWHDFIPA
jgi:ectoine hydroxylase-related dioxygenase (phytanoyl-CoA dioxygenase family)